MLSINTVHLSCCECGNDHLVGTDPTEYALLTTCPGCGNREPIQDIDHPEVARVYDRLLKQEDPELFRWRQSWLKRIAEEKAPAYQAYAA